MEREGAPEHRDREGDRLLFGFLKKRDRTEESASKTGVAFSRILGGIFSRKELDETFWETLEEALITSDIGMDTTLGLVDQVRRRVKNERVTDPSAVRALLRDQITSLLADVKTETPDLIQDDRKTIVLVVGVNGVGKTTSIAKLAYAAKSEGSSVLLAAADTFRAGAIEQLQLWGNRIGVDVVAHQAGSDPGAVAYDALAAAKARGTELVLVDTAGRLHTRHNLMEEMKKVNRIVRHESGDYVCRSLLVMDATTGQNGLLQARAFGEAVGCDGVFLTKLDGTARGGIVLAIAGELKLPVWFIGTGERLEDLSPFDPARFAGAIVPEPAEATGR